MKKYDVYGIGNALVDFEVKVDDNFLNENKIEKGLMTLVEEERQVELTNALNGKEIQKACGGSAANTVIAVSQFGGKSFYSCKVSSDETGKFYLADMNENGVAVNLDPANLPEGTTGKCMVMVTPDAERTMNTFLGITATYSEEELRKEELKKSEFLYIEGYLVASPTGQLAAVAAKKFAQENDVKTALTFSDPNMVKFFKANIDEIVGDGVDLLFCNEEEALTFTGKANVEDAASDLKSIAKTFAITLGSKGALLFNGEQYVNIDAHKIEALDSNGAGDMFAGAFLYGITNGKSFKDSGDLASLAASRVVSKFGPRLEKDAAKALL